MLPSTCYRYTLVALAIASGFAQAAEAGTMRVEKPGVVAGCEAILSVALAGSPTPSRFAAFDAGGGLDLQDALVGSQLSIPLAIQASLNAFSVDPNISRSSICLLLIPPDPPFGRPELPS